MSDLSLGWVMMDVRPQVGLGDDGCQTSLGWVMMDVRPQVGLGDDGCQASGWVG